MKKRIAFICLMIACLLLQGCIQPRPDTGETSGNGGTQPSQTPPFPYHQTAQYTYHTAVDEDALMTGLDVAYLVLANKDTPVGKDYQPEDLVDLTCSTTRPMQLDACAAAALYEMLEEMEAAGVANGLYVTSAYRSYGYQQSLYQTYLEKELSGISQDAYNCLGYDYIQTAYLDLNKSKLSMEDAKKVVLSYSAYPGTSEHQTGLCVDFITDSMGGQLTVAFEKTDAFAWLTENAYKFGFIIRYPKGKENVTGYTYEPWHYRFVGREVATDIYFGGLTLEQYLGK